MQHAPTCAEFVIDEFRQVLLLWAILL